MKYLVILLALLISGSLATYVRYESLDPCVWMEQDLSAANGLPLLVVQARIRAEFLLDGITEPAPNDCLMAWWDLRSEGLPDSE